MNKVRAAYFFFCAVVLVSGCATFTAPRDYKIVEGTKDGLVIVSFTQPFRVVKWMYRDLKAGKGVRGLNEKFISTTSKFGNAVIGDGGTLMYPLVLPEGEYEFYRWTEPEVGHYFASTAHFSIQFRSIPGKVLYIGNLYVPMVGNQYGLRVRDNHQKEVQLFKKHYPNIRDDQIEVRLMELKGFDGKD